MIGAPVRAESTNMTEMMKGDAIQDVADTTRTVLVWDPLVRSSHWGLVAAFAVAWLAADEVQPLHEAAGYAVAGRRRRNQSFHSRFSHTTSRGAALKMDE